MTRRIALIVAVVLAALLPATPPVPTVHAAPEAAVAAVREYEVRLRKLYMVRPDLLQYPIPYDVVC